MNSFPEALPIDALQDLVEELGLQEAGQADEVALFESTTKVVEHVLATEKLEARPGNLNHARKPLPDPMTASLIRLASESHVWLRSRVLGSDLDCLTLFIGERIKTLVEAHRHIVRCFSSGSSSGDIADCLAASAAVRECYDIRRHRDEPSVLLRDEVFLRPAAIEDLEVELQVRTRRRTSNETIPVRRLTALAALLWTLRGTMTRAEAVSHVRSVLADGEAGWAIALLERLESAGLVETGPPTPNRLATASKPGRVTFLGHSSLLVQAADTTVLFDPLLRFDLGLPRTAFDVTGLKLDALVCSHSHWDHCDPQTYAWFDKSTPVLIPRVRRPTALNPPLASMFYRLGFRDVRELDPWQRTTVGGIEIVAVPFHGEQDEPGEEFDHFTYVIRADDLTIYGGVDIYRDSFGEMTAILDRVREEFQPNVAFLPCSDVVYRYDQGGGNRFCRYFDRARAGASVQYTAPPEEAARWARILDAPIVIPYALFLFSRWATHPGIRGLARALDAAGLGDRFWPLRPLGSISAGDLTSGPRRNIRRLASGAWYRLAPFVAPG